MNIEVLLIVITATIVSFGVTVGLMRPLLRMCQAKNIYDMPNERKVHQGNIPRLGGVLFTPAMLVGVASAIVCRPSFFDGAQLSIRTILISIGIFLLYLIGIFDDLFGLSAKLKFYIQFGVALFLPFCGLYIHSLYGLFGVYELSDLVSYPLTVLVSLLIVNAINLIDGIDGLSSSLSIIALFVFGCLYFKGGLYLFSIFSFALMGAVIAFFFFNFFGKSENCTKTFMGDTGSLTLGYALTFLGMRYVMTNHHGVGPNAYYTALLVPFTLLFVPCIDLIRVAIGRKLKGGAMFRPDKTHIHHKCLQAGLTMHQSLFAILALQCVIGLINLIAVQIKLQTSFVFIGDIAIYAAFFLILRAYTKRQTKHTDCPIKPSIK